MGYPDGVGYGSGFALLVVLFILLIIVGAAFWYSKQHRNPAP
ncbi:YjcZ family sporulation protein [Terrilactibacillus sp. S3-3]|nr:YjcZ family sporulation protein [Terrilactibacillus sp. S3-3]